MLLLTADVFAEPFWGSRTSRPVDTEPQKLKRGQFIWNGDTAAVGSMVAEVSISEQRIYLYRNGILLGVSTISTGRGRRGTPTGVFTVLEKSRYHRSRKYNNAPMPYAHRLTLDGIAMHAGNLPGYPASHGCIRLPTQFARFLFESSAVGMQVVITNQQSTAFALTHATQRLPADRMDENLIKTAALSPTTKESAPQNLKPQEPAFFKPDEKSTLITALDTEIQKTEKQLAILKKQVAEIEKSQRK